MEEANGRHTENPGREEAVEEDIWEGGEMLRKAHTYTRKSRCSCTCPGLTCFQKRPEVTLSYHLWLTFRLYTSRK